MLLSEKCGYSSCKSFTICAVENFLKPRSLNTLAKQSWFVSSLFSCMTLLLDGFLGGTFLPRSILVPILKSTETFLAKLSKIAHSRKKERRYRNYAIRFAAASQRQERSSKFAQSCARRPTACMSRRLSVFDQTDRTPVGIMNSYVRHQAHARQFTRPNWERLSRIPARCVAAVAFCLLR